MITKAEAKVQREFSSTSLLPDSLTRRKYWGNNGSQRSNWICWRNEAG